MTSSNKASQNARIGALVAGLCILLFVAGFLVLFAGAQLDYATAGLVVASGSLIYALVMLFRMVQALSRPAGELRARTLGGISRSKLREEKRRVLRAINELTFDFEMGKLSKADYDDVRKKYELRAVDVMRELDGARTVHPDVTALLEEHGIELAREEPAAKEDKASAETVEDETPAASEDKAAVETAAQDDAENADAENADAQKADVDAETSEPVEQTDMSEEDTPSTEVECGTCEGKNDADAKFCKHCGKEMKR